MDSEPRYPIREVSRQTGVNPVTLRAWQRRYGLLKPARTGSGHRLYSDADIALIRRILHWLDQGVNIGQVKALLANPSPPPARGSNWALARERLTETAQALNLARLETELRELAGLYPAELLLRRVIEPWLAQLGELARPDRGIIEHSARALLGRLLTQLLTLQTGPRIAVVRAGRIDALAGTLLLYELQSLECRGLDLGPVDPAQIPLAAARLDVRAYLVAPGAGLNASWFEEHAAHWQADSYFVGKLGRLYRDRGWLTHPYAETPGELMRDCHAFLSLVQK